VTLCPVALYPGGLLYGPRSCVNNIAAISVSVNVPTNQFRWYSVFLDNIMVLNSKHHNASRCVSVILAFIVSDIQTSSVNVQTQSVRPPLQIIK